MIPFEDGNAEVNVTTNGKLLPGEILAFDASIVKVNAGSGVSTAGDDDEGLQLIFKQKSKTKNVINFLITTILLQLILVPDCTFFQ